MESVMAQFVVRNLDDEVTAALKRRARMHGRSMEEEVRHILGRALIPGLTRDPGLVSGCAGWLCDWIPALD